MSTPTAKKLTAAGLNKLSSKLNSRTKISVLNDKYEVEVHTHFRESLIDNVVIDYIQLLQDLKATVEPETELVKDTVVLLNVLILREFTNLPIPRKARPTDLIKLANNLLDLGIMGEVFPYFQPEQMRKIEEKMKLTSKNISSVMGELALAQSVSNTSEDHVGGENDAQ
ncbi:hypothetical protein [Paenibacillus tuaregi]|uniref:hypothetical protein n=1 Tax=Paenibacillus tuaregi TaxID=1816681 RepID=UPI00083939A3|nr:hypothetical protein [Paenibacillus tuaregi]